eukprot:maker-scaffold_6-snap-gene-17.31-mRNA-1 protein AED:0.02 eAED:0.02 QI:196/1/1/1/1/1/4/62/635
MKNAEGIPYITLPDGQTQKPPLADGEYDAIILSTGLEECILAGLLAIRGKKVLQVDPNDFYGGSCASLSLKQLIEKFSSAENVDASQLQDVFGASRDFCVDLVPKLLLASGKLVKMLVQTGVTRYMEFCGIDSSYVYNSGKIYKLPVTPTEALTSSLVRIFQKPKLRSFAEFIGKYRKPIDIDMPNMITHEKFNETIQEYCAQHGVSVPDLNIPELKNMYQRKSLVHSLEKSSGFPVFPVTLDLTLSTKAPLGLKIEGVPTKSSVHPYVVRVQECVKGSQAEKTRQIEIDDVFYSINDVVLYGKTEKEVKGQIISVVQSGVPEIKISFLKNFKFAEKTLNHRYARYQKSKTLTAEQLMDEYGLDTDTKNFIGHGMALETSDDYLKEKCVPFIENCRVYANSIGRYGQKSPYLYPQYGLASLPEGFARLAAIHGGTVMLRTKPGEIIYHPETKKVWGLEADGMVARLKAGGVLIGDAQFFPEQRKRKTGTVIRSICLLESTDKSSEESAQLIIPAKHIANKNKDVYVSILTDSQKVCSGKVKLAIASTTIENDLGDPTKELEVAFEVIKSKGRILKRFDLASDTYEGVAKNDGIYITTSLDATSHFESAAKDIMRIYQKIFGVQLNLDEKIIKTQE